MSETPKRIWLLPFDGEQRCWCEHPDPSGNGLEDEATEYIRADLAPAPSVIIEATDPDFIWGALDNVHDADTTLDDYAAAVSRAIRAALLAAIQVSPAPGWQPIETAPHDKDILVWYDHDADPYQDPNNPGLLTPYAAWAEGGDFLLGKGICIVRHHPPHWEVFDEYGSGHWMPAAWFAHEDNDYERAVNPTHWMSLPAPPSEEVEP